MLIEYFDSIDLVSYVYANRKRDYTLSDIFCVVVQMYSTLRFEKWNQ